MPDFVVYDLLGRPATDPYHVFGAANECAVWRAFATDLGRPRKETQARWLYNGDAATADWPGDMGYFVGRRIAAAYYAQADDKTKALRTLSKPRKYKRVLRRSGYEGTCDK